MHESACTYAARNYPKLVIQIMFKNFLSYLYHHMQFIHQNVTEGKSYIDLITISEEFLFQFFEKIACLDIQVDEGSGLSSGSKCMLLTSRL